VCPVVRRWVGRLVLSRSLGVITMQLKYSPFWLYHNAGSEFGSNHDSHQLKEVLTRTTGG